MCTRDCAVVDTLRFPCEHSSRECVRPCYRPSVKLEGLPAVAGGEGLRLAAATGAQYRRVDDESKLAHKFHPAGFEFYRNLHKFHNLNNNNNHSSKNNNNNDSPPSDKAAAAAAAAAAMILQQHHRIGGLLAGRRPSSCDVTAAAAAAADQQPLDLSSLSVPKYNNGGRAHPYFTHHHHSRVAAGHQQSTKSTVSSPPPPQVLMRSVHTAVGSSSEDDEDEDDDDDEDDERGSIGGRRSRGDQSSPIPPPTPNENGKSIVVDSAYLFKIDRILHPVLVTVPTIIAIILLISLLHGYYPFSTFLDPLVVPHTLPVPRHLLIIINHDCETSDTSVFNRYIGKRSNTYVNI